jgi:ATP-dependent helicase Lhr and Lhr-like helicase
MPHTTDAAQLDAFLEQHRRIREHLPAAWNAFFAKFGVLRPVQLATVPKILAGENVLLTAPTAGGKTEAVIAPLCERLVQGRWPGLSTIVVTPTRALVNDLFRRLESPMQEMAVRLGRKTADHAITVNATEQVLITTPESLESLLTFRRSSLRHLRALVIDEIHLLDGSARGDQLRMMLSRLAAVLRFLRPDDGGSLQRIAISATLADPQRVANAYLGASSCVVQVSGQRDLEAQVIMVMGDDQTRARAAVESLDEWEDVRKVLVFVNSRQQVDLAAKHFQHGIFSRGPVYGHHGSLSKLERERVEERFREGRSAICVATMTLEIGIDIGDVDMVICMDPPLSLSSFLQRIGRGCRRKQGKTRVVCLARDRASELIFQALLRQSSRGIPEHPVAPIRRSVLAQQILAYLKQVDKHRRTRHQFVRVFTTAFAPAVSETLVDQLLQDMVNADLLNCRDNVYSPGKNGWEFVESNLIYANISSNAGEVTLVDADTGATVATVRDVPGGNRGVVVAGRSYDVLSSSRSFKRLVRHGGEHEATPRYRTSGLPYAFDIGVSLASYLECPRDTLWVLQRDDQAIVFTWLGRLLNETLASGLKAVGERTKATAFTIKIGGHVPRQALDKLRQAVSGLRITNPLANVAVERLADLGAHLGLFEDGGIRRAREDWLNITFLESWVDSIRQAEPIERLDPRRSNLEVLALK